MAAEKLAPTERHRFEQDGEHMTYQILQFVYGIHFLGQVFFYHLGRKHFLICSAS